MIRKNNIEDDLMAPPNKADGKLKRDELLRLYEQMVLIRNFELTVQQNYQKGEIPGFIHLCIGQEAVAVGVCSVLRKEDWITSTHRGHGHAIAKGVEISSLMAELYGKKDGCNGGRGGSMHLYSFKDGLFGTNGLVGGGIPLAVGLAISSKVKKSDNVAVSFFGDGAINHGTFHESLSFASVQNAPVIFVCENNLYATCTPLSVVSRNKSISEKAASYGIPGITVDGNDVIAVREATIKAVERARNGGGPTLIEALTYRTVGHHEGDVVTGTYRTAEELEIWKTKCPVTNFEKFITGEGYAKVEEVSSIEARVSNLLSEAVSFARQSPFPEPSTIGDHCFAEPFEVPDATGPMNDESQVQSWLIAVRNGIAEEMRKDRNIIYLGEGIGERGGTFGHTRDLWKEFGANRVIDTPICELAFTGAAAAASADGSRAIADLMFADFIFEAASQLVNQASKLRYMSNGQVSVPVIIRAGSGQIKQAGPQHSGTFQSIWAHCPGLLVVVPSNPADAKGLMKTALRSGDPVIFLEPKALFSTKGPVPQGDVYVPFGKAAICRTGTDLTIVSFGLPLVRSIEAARDLEATDISCEVIDLRTIVPLDITTVLSSVSKTRHLLIVEEGNPFCSVASEITTQVMERSFTDLKRPVMRLTRPNVPQPFSPSLEQEVTITKEKIITKAREMLANKI